MLNAEQLRSMVVVPVLYEIGLWSASAEALVMGTALVESNLTYIAQLKGPALGLWQMEPATHNDIWKNYLSGKPDLARRIIHACAVRTHDADVFNVDVETLVYNLRYAAAMCRIHYRRVPTALPAANDFDALANYWKDHYNTRLGSGQPAHFIARMAQAQLTIGV